MVNVLTPKGFLQVGGVVLLLVGILGYIGIIGPTPEQSLFGSFWWFDNAENVAHTVLGVVALIAVVALKSDKAQKTLVMLVGVLALVVAAYNLFVSPTLLGAELQLPPDFVLHVVVGVWGLVASMKKPAMTPVAAASM